MKSSHLIQESPFLFQVTSLDPTLEVLENFLSRIQNSAAGQETAQLIGAVSSILNVNAKRNKSEDMLIARIKVITRSSLIAIVIPVYQFLCLLLYLVF